MMTLFVLGNNHCDMDFVAYLLREINQPFTFALHHREGKRIDRRDTGGWELPMDYVLQHPVPSGYVFLDCRPGRNLDIAGPVLWSGNGWENSLPVLLCRYLREHDPDLMCEIDQFASPAWQCLKRAVDALDGVTAG